MKCPNCKDFDLLMSERKGIEIDYCPSCRGVWLDRGELDKFIQQVGQQDDAHSLGKASPVARHQAEPGPGVERNDDDHRRYEERRYDDRKSEDRDFRDDDRQYHRYGKKKESFWSNLFDFD